MAMPVIHRTHLDIGDCLLTTKESEAIPKLHAQATSDEPGLAVLVDGRYIIKAGTIYPANDESAIGVVRHNYDVTEGDAVISVVIHGVINSNLLPAVPSADAVAAMKGVSFYPVIEDAAPASAASVKALEERVEALES